MFLHPKNDTVEDRSNIRSRDFFTLRWKDRTAESTDRLALRVNHKGKVQITSLVKNTNLANLSSKNSDTYTNKKGVVEREKTKAVKTEYSFYTGNVRNGKEHDWGETRSCQDDRKSNHPRKVHFYICTEGSIANTHLHNLNTERFSFASFSQKISQRERERALAPVTA